MKKANPATDEHYEEIKQSKKAEDQSPGSEAEKGRKGWSHKEVDPRLDHASSRVSTPLILREAGYSIPRPKAGQ